MPNALTNHYQCSDQHWFILSIVNQDREWPALVRALERPDLEHDPRFASRAARGENVDHLVPHAIAARVLEAYGPGR